MNMFFARAAVGLALLPTVVAASERQHDAHEHGHALLQIVQDGPTLQIALQSPAANIVGFEHQAESADDKNAVAVAAKLLGNPAQLFTPGAAAKCVLDETEVESELLEPHDDHDKHEDKHGHDDDHGDEETHSEFHAEYTYTCEKPDALEYIDINLLAHFSGIEELDVQIATADGQAAVELESGETRVELP